MTKIKTKWSNNMINFLINHYRDMGVDYCVKELGINRRSIIYKANSIDLKTNVINKCESKTKNKVNHELFSSNITKESAYILGLLWADGNILSKNKLTSINCVKDDLDNVINVFLETGDWLISKPIKKYHKGREVKTQIKISTTTWALYDILVDFGFKNKSTNSPDNLLNSIPNNLKKYWFRGYLDGDGCIKVYNNRISLTFTSTINQDWKFMVNLCEQLNINFGIYKNKVNSGGYSHFTISKKNDVKIICDYLYSDYDNIGFVRKHKKYLDVLKFINNKSKIQWCDDDIDWLLNNYSNLGAKKCAKYLNKTLNSVYNKIRYLKNNDKY